MTLIEVFFECDRVDLFYLDNVRAFHDEMHWLLAALAAMLESETFAGEFTGDIRAVRIESGVQPDNPRLRRQELVGSYLDENREDKNG